MNRILVVVAIAALVLIPNVRAFTTEEYDSWSSESHYESNNPGFFERIGLWFRDLWPFGSRLGHDWATTQERVENIYRDTHAHAQRRVEALKEEALKDHTELQDKIAQIYYDAAVEAEKRIDRMKHSVLSSLIRGRSYEKDVSSSYSSSPSSIGLAYEKLKDRLSPTEEHSLFQDTTKKIHDAYRSALDKAKLTAGSMEKTSGDTLAMAKARARKIYDDAFHKSHGETRSMFGRLRDSLGYGLHRAADLGKSAACKTWNMLMHALVGVFWLSLGVLVATSGMYLWNRRRFNRVLYSHMTGPITHVQEYMVMGNEALQRKWLEFWSTAGAAYFNRQPGLRKFTMNRGAEVDSKKWICIGDWNSVDDLRRALSNPEFIELKRRAPATVIPKDTIIVTAAYGGKPVEGDVLVGNKDTMRQRQTTTTTTTNYGTTSYAPSTTTTSNYGTSNYGTTTS